MSEDGEKTEKMGQSDTGPDPGKEGTGHVMPPPPVPPDSEDETDSEPIIEEKDSLDDQHPKEDPKILEAPPEISPSEKADPGPQENEDIAKPQEVSLTDEEEEKKESKDSKGVFSFKKIKDTLIKVIKGPPKEARVMKKAKPEKLEVSDEFENLELMETLVLTDFVKVQIFLNPETSDYIYHPVEPKLAPKQKKVLDFILETLNKALSYNKMAMEDLEEKESFLDKEVKTILKDYSSVIKDANEEFMRPIRYYIRREFIGYGRINSIMLDSGVEDVSCDGTGIPVFVYHRDFGSIRTTIQFETDEELEGFVVSLAQRAGKSISVALPILDATLPEGHRLNATFGREVTTRGSSFTIRKFKEDPLTITDLVKFGTLSPEMAAHFWMGVQYGDSMIFAGGTASGKTATMNAISIFIPTSAKIISIEDTREVNLPHKNWIAGITRGSAESGKETDIDMYQLLRAALRQRPEYVLVGEVRGKETMTMFQAMSTGHVTYSTMHADSVKSIVYRLENPPISIPRVLIQVLNLVAIHNQIRVRGMRVRRITELVEIVGIEPTSLEIITNRVYKWEAAGDRFIFGGHSNLYEKVMDFEDLTRDEVVTELNRRAEVIDWMLRNDVRKFKDVSTIVAEYYEDSDKVIRLLRENPKIDISEGLNIFEDERAERLPPSLIDSLPSAGTTTGGA
jgi:flagellar protein FlaI